MAKNNTKSTKNMGFIVSIIVAAVLLFGGISLYNSRSNTLDNSATTEQSTQTTKPEISFSSDGKVVKYAGQDGQTALALLQAGTQVETQESSFGEFVSGINGVQANAAKNYWAFYVDGDYATEGAGSYQTKDGQMIEWRLEDLQ